MAAVAAVSSSALCSCASSDRPSSLSSEMANRFHSCPLVSAATLSPAVVRSTSASRRVAASAASLSCVDIPLPKPLPSADLNRLDGEAEKTNSLPSALTVASAAASASLVSASCTRSLAVTSCAPASSSSAESTAVCTARLLLSPPPTALRAERQGRATTSRSTKKAASDRQLSPRRLVLSTKDRRIVPALADPFVLGLLPPLLSTGSSSETTSSNSLICRRRLVPPPSLRTCSASSSIPSRACLRCTRSVASAANCSWTEASLEASCKISSSANRERCPSSASSKSSALRIISASPSGTSTLVIEISAPARVRSRSAPASSLHEIRFLRLGALPPRDCSPCASEVSMLSANGRAGPSPLGAKRPCSMADAAALFAAGSGSASGSKSARSFCA
mmetsp:Transcript_10733/g.27121  ORF Transcript_10733/g.27121 Transcript_10733/m.27121 type:complete len:393 (-) Transcript_10733:2119-3297(-)